MFSIDIAGAAVKLYQTIREDRVIAAWLQLIFSTGYSGFLGLCGGWGVALVAGKAPWIAFGAGALGSGAAVLAVLLQDPQGRKLLLVAPSAVVTQYQANELTTIQPTAKK